LFFFFFLFLTFQITKCSVNSPSLVFFLLISYFLICLVANLLFLRMSSKDYFFFFFSVFIASRCTKDDCSDPLNSKYYLIILQYTTQMKSHEIVKFVRDLTKGKRKNYHFRFATPEDSLKLSGYEVPFSPSLFFHFFSSIMRCVLLA